MGVERAGPDILLSQLDRLGQVAGLDEFSGVHRFVPSGIEPAGHRHSRSHV